MNYWLVKSEPSSWSWDQQVEKGAKGEAWTGVRNFTARQNLVNMKKGDKAFFYHSKEGKEIVGIAEVIKEAYPDPTDKTGKFVCVDIKADKPMPKPVTMVAIKADKKLAAMALVKYSRLSVQPVTSDELKPVCKTGGLYSAIALGRTPSLFSFLSAHDLVGKPLHTFPDHALVLGQAKDIAGRLDSAEAVRAKRNQRHLRLCGQRAGHQNGF